MTTLTEQAAERLIADRAFAPGPPGFVGAAVDLLLAAPGVPDALIGPLGARPPLRHGFLTARSAHVLVVSGPPSPGVEACLDRMTDDLAAPLLDGLLYAASQAAAFGGPLDSAMDPAAPAETAGVRVGLEAGQEGGGPLGLERRWRLAHTLAPVLAAAFANSPGAGWRSVRQARHRLLPVVPRGADPRGAWAAYVLDSPTEDGGTFRERLRETSRPSAADLVRHLEALRPPVAARGHLEIDVVDRQAGAGWRVAVAVTAVLLDDARAAQVAEAATAHLAAEPRLWERAARDALTDPVLAAAARECFLAAYAALARRGTPREAVGEFIERYVSRGRCPADDLLSYRHVRG